MKNICFCLVLSILIGIFSADAINTSSTESLLNEEQSYSTAVRNITVYLIKQVGGNTWSKSAVSAEYDSESNTIKVGKFIYSVYTNRAYGQENDGRADYKYVAGDYYFNL